VKNNKDLLFLVSLEKLFQALICVIEIIHRKQTAIITSG
jgi:hypothetical protein